MKTNFSLNLCGRQVDFDRPAVMAIINVTPDSFFEGSRSATAADVARATERALAEGADMLDLGAYSTRPGCEDVDPAEETHRLTGALEVIRGIAPLIPVSVDTFRAPVARAALDAGADIINDISGGELDPDMFALVAERRTPYILMHMRGTPQTMQQFTDYSAEGSVTAAVLRFLAERVSRLRDMGAHDIIVDPGFGFAKTLEQNYELLTNLPLLGSTLRCPVLAGLSRKSMFYKPLGVTPAHVLPATCAANLLALQGGASILRVHDVAAARQVVEVALAAAGN